MRNYCTAVLIALLLGACGLKAPLYLPQQQGEAQSKQPSQDQKK
jgi:predicted small lipoprotein YifL